MAVKIVSAGYLLPRNFYFSFIPHSSYHTNSRWSLSAFSKTNQQHLFRNTALRVSVLRKMSTGLSPEEVERLCAPAKDDGAKDFLFQQTMYRIRDPRVSLPFYSHVLGMTLLQQLHFPEMKFSLFFMGYEPQANVPIDSKERKLWAMTRKATLELTHNWGTEDGDSSYHNGNSEPRGFGHIGLLVPDVQEACDRFERLGVKFVKKPQDGKMKGLAFIQDPDGYWIEIFDSKTVQQV